MQVARNKVPFCLEKSPVFPAIACFDENGLQFRALSCFHVAGGVPDKPAMLHIDLEIFSRRFYETKTRFSTRTVAPKSMRACLCSMKRRSMLPQFTL